MALPEGYSSGIDPLSRAFDVVGERWTLLIVREAFFGVRRFGDFEAHLGIPRVVLAERLANLVDSGILAVLRGSYGHDEGHGHDEYVLTEKGGALWPAARSSAEPR